MDAEETDESIPDVPLVLLVDKNTASAAEVCPVVWCSVVQCVVVCGKVCGVLCCSVVQCPAVCCSVWQCVPYDHADTTHPSAPLWVSHTALIQVGYHIHTCRLTHSYAWLDAFIRVASRIHTGDTTHSFRIRLT